MENLKQSRTTFKARILAHVAFADFFKLALCLIDKGFHLNRLLAYAVKRFYHKHGRNKYNRKNKGNKNTERCKYCKTVKWLQRRSNKRYKSYNCCNTCKKDCLKNFLQASCNCHAVLFCSKFTLNFFKGNIIMRKDMDSVRRVYGNKGDRNYT